MQTLLLVEDDAAIAEPLARALRRDGYEVTMAADGIEAVDLGTTGAFDIVILDLGLPRMDGLEVCRRLREHDTGLPILMLTARAEELDTVVGLDAGADDYVPKPFRLAELLARVRALLRRSSGPGVGNDAASGVRIDEAARRAWLDGDELRLTPKEFDLLAILISHQGKVVGRERIMEEVWDEHWFGSTKTLDMHISSLRKKLRDDASNPRIATVRGVGYRYETS